MVTWLDLTWSIMKNGDVWISHFSNILSNAAYKKPYTTNYIFWSHLSKTTIIHILQLNCLNYETNINPEIPRSTILNDVGTILNKIKKIQKLHTLTILKRIPTSGTRASLPQFIQPEFRKCRDIFKMWIKWKLKVFQITWANILFTIERREHNKCLN